MTASGNDNGSPAGRTFTWHPDYQSQTVDQVQRELRDEIARDQRQYALSLDGAEMSEFQALSSVVELERRWGQFDFDWAELDPDMLATRIAEFEWEREQRQELFPFAAYRAESPGHDTGEEITPELAWKTRPVIITAALGLLVIVLILFLTL